MRSWPAPDLPTLPVTGPEVALHDTATGALVTPRPEGPARVYVCGITPYDATHIGHAATYVAFDLLNRAWRNAGHDVTYVQNVTDVDDPLLERADQGRGRLGGAGRAGDRALPAGHDRLAGAAADPLRRCGRVDPAGGRPGRAPPGRRRHLPGRGRPLLLRDRRPGVRRGVGADPRRDAEDLPRARGRPRPRRQEGPSRLRGVAGRAARRAVVGQPVRTRPPRLAHRVRRHRPGHPRHDLRRAGRRQRPDLPPPRDVRAGSRRWRPGGRSRGSTRTPGWWATTARRCRSRAATSSSSPRCATATSTRWRSG